MHRFRDISKNVFPIQQISHVNNMAPKGPIPSSLIRWMSCL